MGSENRLIQMVVFDWAGTTVDYGCSVPSVEFDRDVNEGGLERKGEGNRRQKSAEKTCLPF